LEFNVPFQHKYGYIRDECADNKPEMSTDQTNVPNNTDRHTDIR